MAKGKVMRLLGRLFGIAPEVDTAAEAAKLARVAEVAEAARGVRLAAIADVNVAIRGIYEEMSLTNGLINSGSRSAVTFSSIVTRAGLANNNAANLLRATQAIVAASEGSSCAASAKKLVTIAQKINDATAAAYIRAMEFAARTGEGVSKEAIAQVLGQFTNASEELASLMAEFENAAVAFEAEVGKDVIVGGGFIVASGITGSDPVQGRLPEHPLHPYFRPIINGGAEVADKVDTLVFGAVDLGATVVGQSVDSRANLENAVEAGAVKLDRAFDQLGKETQSGFRKVENSIINNSGWGM
ncbi:MAG: hypothetical protein K1X66_08105 [Verrucomicrobiae bacterium]|nr:hypothetical protein [Verrucomicrobiae bacterium]